MKTLFTFATVALAAATFAAGPQGVPGRGPMSGGPRMGMAEGASDPVVRMVTNPKFAEKIGLSEEQSKKIKEIDKANRDNCKELRQTVQTSMKKQAELLKAEKIDEAAVMAEIDKAFEARKSIAKYQTKRIIAIKSVLTPEQITKALEEAKNGRKRGNLGDRPKRKGANGDKSGKGPDGDKSCGEPPKGDKPGDGADGEGPDGKLPPPPPEE